MRVQSNSRRVFGLFVRTVSRIDVGDVIQVGGARNAAGDDKGGRVAPVRDRGDTNRAGKALDASAIQLT
jgi:hypothetical protein